MGYCQTNSSPFPPMSDLRSRSTSQRMSMATTPVSDAKSPDLEKQPGKESPQPLLMLQSRVYYATCIVLHLALVVAHVVLVAHAYDGKPLHLAKENWFTDGLFYIVVVAPNAIGKVRVMFDSVS